jgi:hypothetical protein
MRRSDSATRERSAEPARAPVAGAHGACEIAAPIGPRFTESHPAQTNGVGLRDWHLRWGATSEEVARTLPGDDLLPDPDVVSTRAIEIAAPRAAVWPWLVQMGPGRGGAYTYDWIENLFGLGMRSADRIHPEWQRLELGDTPSVKPGSEPGPNAMRVRVLEPEQALVTASDDGRWVWAFVLLPVEAGTRLVSRNRIRAGSSLGARLGLAVMTPGSWVMERKMLTGIKERAERLAREDAR